MIRRIVPVLAIAAALGACSHNAYEPATPGTVNTSRSGTERRAGQREDMMLSGITLSSDQQQAIDAIRTKYRAQIEQARQDAGGDRAAMRERVQPLMQKQQAEIRAVLTADQQAQYDRNVAEMRARMQQGRRPNG